MPGSATNSAQSKSSPASVKAPTAKCPSVAGTSTPVQTSSPMTSEVVGSPVEGREEERAELLGSLTTQAHQRTSARVIKKLKLDDQDRERKDSVECELQKLKEFDAEVDKLAVLGVKQRTPKALWSTDEKNLFFEALNEYGKDFDSITSYICNKMKKKGVSDCNLKTKNQVSHFYYRTWHKLSKHVHFDESVKKVAQELYALINYGELRRRLPRGGDKWCARVWELARAGTLVLRARGRTLRLRTPPCRALRHLNQLSEEGEGLWRVWRVCVVLRARSVCAWRRVCARAHNPRARTHVAPRTRLQQLLQALQRRWGTYTTAHNEDKSSETIDEEELEKQRYLPSESMSPEEWLHVSPPARLSPCAATLRPAPLAHRALCYTSYLQRLGHQATKLPPPKRQRKDSASEREGEGKRVRGTGGGTGVGTGGGGGERAAPDDAAVDVDMMQAHATTRESCEREKGSQSEDENRSESETEIERRTERPLKVKFRIGPLEGAHKWEHSEPCDKQREEQPKAQTDWIVTPREPTDYPTASSDECVKPEDGQTDKLVDESDVDVGFAMRQIRKGWSAMDAGELTIGDLYLMFGSRSKLELDYWWAEPTPPLPQPIVAKQQPSRPISELDKTPPTERDKKTDKTPEKEQDDDIDVFSPKNVYNQDSNDGMSGDERKESGSGVDRGVSLCLASKLVNRPEAPPPKPAPLTNRLRALLRLAGNPLLPLHTDTTTHTDKHELCPARIEERNVFRHPTPIAPKPAAPNVCSSSNVGGVGVGGSREWDAGGRRRGGAGGRARGAGGVVVQRLLPLSPRDTRTHNLIPVKLERQLPRLLPKPMATHTADGPCSVVVVRERDGQYYCTDTNGDQRVLTSLVLRGATSPKRELKEELQSEESCVTSGVEGEPAGEGGTRGEGKQQAVTLPEGAVSGESLSLSPGRLLAGSVGEGEGGGGATWGDCSLSSFLAELDEAAQHTESPLTSLLAESSIDYVAKFADLAAELEAPTDPDLDPAELASDSEQISSTPELAVATPAEQILNDANNTTNED